MLEAFFFNPPLENNYLGHQMAEVYKEKVYDPYFSGKKDLVIFDIGANIGVTSYYFSKFARIIHAFEPSKEHFDVLTHQLQFNGLLGKVVPHQMAIANTDGDGVFYHQGNKTMFSLHPPSIDPTQTQEMVQTQRLDTFFRQNMIEHVDFMKLDCEGSEADIICGDGFQNVADKIDVLFLERHTWNGRHPNQLTDAIKQAGFVHIEKVPNQADLLICTKEQ